MVFQNEIFRPSNNWTIFANVNKLQSGRASKQHNASFFNNTRIGVTKKLIDQQISSGFPNLNSFTFLLCALQQLCAVAYTVLPLKTLSITLFFFRSLSAESFLVVGSVLLSALQRHMIKERYRFIFIHEMILMSPTILSNF